MNTRMATLAGLLLTAVLFLGAARGGSRFVDLDGDGFHDAAPDRDGDGLPDCVDPDTRKALRTGGPWRARPDSLTLDSLLFRGYVDRRGSAPAGYGAGNSPRFGWEGWSPGPRGGRFLSDPTRQGQGGSGGGGGNGGGHGPGGR